MAESSIATNRSGVISVTKMWSGRSKSKTSAREGYQVATNDARINGPTVEKGLLSPGADQINIPHYGEYLPGSNLLVLGKSSRAVGPLLWEVIVEYGTKDAAATSGGTEATKLDMDWHVRISGGRFIEAVDQDIEGDAIVSSALETWEQPVTRSFHDLVYSCWKNVPSFVHQATLVTYFDHVNRTEFMEHPEMTVLCEDGDISDWEDDDGFRWWRLALTFRARLLKDPVTKGDLGHKVRRLDVGYRFNKDAERDSEFERIWTPARDKVSGELATRPILLNGRGDEAVGGKPTWLTWDLYERAEFNDLGITRRVD